jgi:hypothetical protein
VETPLAFALAELERFDPIKTKKLLDTSTGQMVDTGVFVGM